MTASRVTPDPGLRCAECARLILRDPIILDDQGYCCLGCLAGGPCICDDIDDAPAGAPSPEGAVPFELEIGPFRGQADLMHIALLLERQPDIAGVALVVADPRHARFAIQAPSADSVTRAVSEMDAYQASVSVVGPTVRAVVATRSAISGEEALLPPRTRFRVFHNVPEPTEGSAPTQAPMA